MFKRIILIGLFFIAANHFVYAQKKKTARDSTTVIIFNEGSSSGYQKKKKAGEDNIIKISPFGFISGVYPLSFERRINDFLGIQVSGGLTFRNYMRSAVQKSGNDLKYEYPWGENASVSNEVDIPFNFDHRKASAGYMFSIEPRLYLESEALEGGYISASFGYSKYNFSIPGLVNDNGSVAYKGVTKKEYENINDFMVCYGNQVIYDKLTLEYSTGIGLRSVKGVAYVAGINYDSNQLMEGFATYKQSVINFNIGLKVGYHF